jgi:DNA-binding transcriptional ArsR family regulator
MHIITLGGRAMGLNLDSNKCKKLIEDNIDIEFFRAVFDPVRSELLVFLSVNGEMTIGGIAEYFPQNRSVISRHLDFMSRFGIVQRRKEGREVYYKTNNNFIVDKFEQTANNMKALLNLK